MTSVAAAVNERSNAVVTRVVDEAAKIVKWPCKLKHANS